MKKAIVTGANGFIGTALCRELAYKNISVVAVVRSEEEDIKNIRNLPNIKIIYCSLENFKNLAEYITDRDADVLYHLAWIGSAGVLRGNDDVQIKNIQYTCDTVKACAKINCKRFVFASSIMEYEINKIMETDTAPSLNTLYSSAKIAADYMARTIASNLGIDYIRAVISNVYGPGELSPRLINSSIRNMLAGKHCSFSSGKQIYDFIYITDAAEAFKAIGQSGKTNRTYYIGSLNPRPLRDFLIELKNKVDPEIKIGLGEIPFEGISLSYNEFDVCAVKNDTGFVPHVSFKEGIQKTIEWIRETEKPTQK